MTTRIEDTLAAATTAFRFVQEHWPMATRTSPLLFAVIARAGAGVGIGAGLLFAPQSGSEFRASLLEKTQGYAGALRTRVEGVVEAAEEEVSSKTDVATRRNGASAPRRSSGKQSARA